ncbi:hypothetical protein IAR50_006171 [Cryptococcus sp. DSM 104548]
MSFPNSQPTPLPSPPASHDGFCCSACRRKDEAPEVDDVWNDSSAEVVLVSSDNVAFHVPGYHIMSQSTALRDALQIDNTLPSSTSPKKPIRITLSDEDCETSSAIRFFLHLAAYGSPSSLLSSHPNDIVKLLMEGILFMQKYDCAPALAQAEAWMRMLARGQGEWEGEGEGRGWGKSVCALDLFLIGAKAGLDGVMVDCVRYYRPRGHWLQPRPINASPTPLLPNQTPPHPASIPNEPQCGEPVWQTDEYTPMLNERFCWGAYTGLTPGEFPILAWEACPPLVMWALSKACKMEEGWEKRGECLEGILKEVSFLR